MDAWILAVDDEPEIAGLVEAYLKSEGRAVFKCGTGTETLAVVRAQTLDLAILDMVPPDISSFTLCGEIRRERHFLVLMLTARTEGMDEITGLTIDANDCIAKSLNSLELMAQVKVQLRRYICYDEADRAGGCRDIIGFNGPVTSRAIHRCTLYDRELGLTSIELGTLWMLHENRGQVASAERFSESVWGGKHLDHSGTVMVCIRRLQGEMGKPSRSPRFIKTVWGTGYKVN